MPEQTKKDTQLKSSPGSATERGGSASAATARERDPEAGQRANGPSELASEANGEDRKLITQVRATANEAYDTATLKATEKLEQQKSNLSSGLANVADVVRQVGDNLEASEIDDKVSRFTSEFSRAAAERIEQAASYFDQRDLNAVYGDVENLARRNPALFVGGAFVFGFLAARFLKSSGPRQQTGGRRPYRVPQNQPSRSGEFAQRNIH